MKVANRPPRRRKVNLRSDSFTLSMSKTYLGRLVEKASKGQTVYIMRGEHRFILQEVPHIDPIPIRPPGYFAHCYSKAELQEQNRLAKASVVRAPAVIISNDGTCQNGNLEEVNALICTSAKVNRPPKPTEELWDEADGLDWKSMVRCDRIYLLSKAKFDDRKGSVTEERRHFIARKMVEVLRLPINRR